MLIISKFHDYYDSVVSSVGVDNTCVYNRKKVEITENILFVHGNWHKEGNIPPCFNAEFILIEPFLVGFCGKIYPGYILNKNTSKNDNKFVYSSKEVIDFYNEVNKKSVSKWNRWRFKPNKQSNKRIKDFFNTKWDNYLFFEKKIPIFVETSSGFGHCGVIFTENPCLKDYEFYKIFDSFSTFQEIHMFLSGVLGNTEKEMIEVSEKDKIASKGFDKWSFRNPDPPKRKQKK